MKKTFKFFLMAAIVAAGFTACSDEVVKPNDGPDGPKDLGEATTATFNFKFAGLNTKADATDMETDKTGEDQTVEVTNIRLLIFNASKELEINEYYKTGDATWDNKMSKTVKLKSGQKQIFVCANETTEIKDILDGLVAGTATYTNFIAALDYPLGGDGGRAPIDTTDFVGGSNPTFDITKVIGATENARTFFLSSAIDASANKTLKPRIEEDDSRNATGANKEEYNNFDITIQRAVAKGIVFYEEKAGILNTLDGLGRLKNGSLMYGIDNVNRSVYLFQQFSGNSVMSTFYNIPNWPNDNKRAPFYPYFYKDYKINNTMIQSTFAKIETDPQTAVYFTENTKAANYNGNITYAAIEAVFTPADGKWVESFTYSPSLDQTTLVLGSNATEGGTIYALKLKDDKLKFADGKTCDDLYLFTDEAMAHKALYLVLNGHLTQADFDAWIITPEASEDIAKYIDEYTNGKCYYRLDIGEGSGENIDCMVTRNTEYDMMITGFKTIGVNDRRKLDNDPWKEKPSDTHVTATIKVKEWEVKRGNSVV